MGSKLQDFINAFSVGECDKTETPAMGKPHERMRLCIKGFWGGERKQGKSQREGEGADDQEGGRETEKEEDRDNRRTTKDGRNKGWKEGTKERRKEGRRGSKHARKEGRKEGWKDGRKRKQARKEGRLCICFEKVKLESELLYGVGDGCCIYYIGCIGCMRCIGCNEGVRMIRRKEGRR